MNEKTHRAIVEFAIIGAAADVAEFTSSADAWDYVGRCFTRGYVRVGNSVRPINQVLKITVEAITE